MKAIQVHFQSGIPDVAYVAELSRSDTRSGQVVIHAAGVSPLDNFNSTNSTPASLLFFCCAAKFN